ncbi:MAG: GntR family transcriptional regulator [Miniphocaeibacter sp.]|uniref:GntR family transcriptional regulator n=1 Tax=Miniphocaeibacter sp. TaxID=3100973 RepID=UPI0017A3F1F1|nr:GntR family transcriptional regulator [Gallicola sp.]
MFINNRIKLSEQLKIELLKYIENMRERGEDKLPSEDNLSNMYKVSRTTVRTVLGELENEGIIVRKHGKGTFLNEKSLPLNTQFSPVALYVDMIKEFGYKSKVEHIGEPEIVEKVDKNIYKKLEVKEDEKIVLTKKIFFADDKPCVFCIDYFPLKLLNNEKDLAYIKDYEDSLFDFFKSKLSKEIIGDQVEIITTTRDETEILSEYFPENVKSFLQLNCINFDEERNPIVYAEEYIDTNLIRFYSLRKK